MTPDLIEAHNALPLSALDRYLPASTWPDNLTLQFHTAASSYPTLFHKCFDLVRDNVSGMYRRSSIGWNNSKKGKEMRHPALRYLPDSGPVLAGFASFMITEEDCEEVIYVYELQFAEGWCGHGLGKKMLRLVEEYGRNVGLRKCMLTVCVENVGAMRFYIREGYEEDAISPCSKLNRRGEMTEPDYKIMSKILD
ncbi:GNAT family acetyltransferase Nat4 [Geopyxis carbonaria]|nr:GNAT family acetyltransferase Nat4 [Geopyxis carbonaria]